jgi:hypothetical protein
MKIMPAWISLLFAFAGHAMAAPVQHPYEWLTNGEKTGSLVLTIDTEQGTRSAVFEFNDRGRGPAITEVTRLSDEGQVISLEITGHSYMGAPVDEHFERTGSGSRWSSTLEQGSNDSAAGFYLANDGTPEQTAMLARALLASPNQNLDLLPGGRARISKLDEFRSSNIKLATGGETSDTQVRIIMLYAISGIGVDPRFVWLDQDGELFGQVEGSSGLLPVGWRGVLKQLGERQDKAEQAYYQTRSGRVTHTIPGDYTITNVQVVDVETSSVLEDRHVLVSGGLITQISEHAPVGEGLELIDGHGGYLAPGLWDMHTHMALQQGVLHLAAGVTTVRDMGNNPERYRAVRDSFDSGSVAGPRSFAAGIVEGKSPFSAPIRDKALSQEGGIELVRKYAGLGYPQIKIYSSLDPSWVEAIAEEAHAQDMRVSGHIPAFMTAEQAVRDGYDEIQHINMLFLNFLAGPEDDTRTPLRFTLVAEQAGALDLASPRVTQFLELLRENEVAVDPTVAIFDNMFRHRSGQVSPAYASIADHFPPAMKRSMLAGRMDINDDNAPRYSAAVDRLLEMIRLLHEQGIQIVAGTDALPGFALHRELELYQQAGIPAAEILKLATLGAARLMNAADYSGSIAVGKQADFVLLADNPLDDISAVRTVQKVFKGDRYFQSAKIYQAVGIKAFN